MSKRKDAAKSLGKSVAKRTLGFFSIFFRSKQGAAGVIIILFFAFVALGSPLLTGNDPIWSQGLAGDLAAPIWIKHLPTFLGGDPKLSENFIPIDTNFKDGIAGWNQTSDSSHISLMWEPVFGIDNGSLKVQFRRDETGVLYGRNNITVYYDFYFPYGGEPRSFNLRTSLVANGTSMPYNATRFVSYNVTTGEYTYEQIQGYRLVAKPIVKVFIQRLSDGAKWTIWPLSDARPNYFKNGTIPDVLPAWLNISLSSRTTDLRVIGYNSVVDVAVETFKDLPGYFRYGFEMAFMDNLNDTIPAETDIYVDDVRFSCPGRAFGLLGTDFYGRDLYSQLVYGSRVSLYVGLLSAAISVVIGLLVGLAAGFLGKAVDEILMRTTDLLLVIPFLPLMLVLVGIFGPTMQNLVILVGILGWMGFARVVRAQVLSLRERAFVEAAKAIGSSKTHIMIRHILPNVMSLVYVTLAASVPGAITAEAALSFLGFYDPSRVSWGRMLNEAQFIGGGALNWWWVVFPGVCIALLSMAFILLGFALDEILNPRLRLRR